MKPKQKTLKRMMFSCHPINMMNFEVFKKKQVEGITDLL
jgi:hypothetical protein